MSILRVKEAFAILSDPNGRVYVPGDLVNDDDPIVKGNPGNFEAVEVVASRGAVEQATAAPGEKRSLTRSAKKAAGKKSASKKASSSKSAATVAKDADSSKAAKKSAPKTVDDAPKPADDKPKPSDDKPTEKDAS